MKRTWRFWVGLWVGKLSATVLRFWGRKGTTFPGVAASRLDADSIKHYATLFNEGIIIVTGTNGKTTTANLLANILQSSGKKFAFNQAGANLVTGITGAMLQNIDWLGRPKVDLALLEVDEATVPKLCEQASPKLAIITNFFRDQLDRYGELDTTVRLVKDSLPQETFLILNADDPLVAQFGLREGTNVLYYGLERTPDSSLEIRETRESRFCPVCGKELDYSLFHYGQLGVFSCPECSFHRPHPQILAKQVRTEDGKIKFRVGVSSYEIALQGYYNLYNALAALTAALQLGIDTPDIARGLSRFVPQAGRMESFDLPEGKVTLALVKNPTGFNQVIRTVLSEERKVSLLIAINDLAADGRDVSWLWDVDFEQLAIEGVRGAKVNSVVCSGLRAEDMAVRLKYAGMSEECLRIEHSLAEAVKLLQAERNPQEAAYALPTYTLLFPLRDILASAEAGGSKSEAGNSKSEA